MLRLLRMRRTTGAVGVIARMGSVSAGVVVGMGGVADLTLPHALRACGGPFPHLWEGTGGEGRGKLRGGQPSPCPLPRGEDREVSMGGEWRVALTLPSPTGRGS